MTVKLQSSIKRIILHCTDSPDDREVTVQEISEWHAARKPPFDEVPAVGGGTTHCGYHYVCQRSGACLPARPEDVVGEHCTGFNTGSLGVVWVGQKCMSDAQKVAFPNLVKDLMMKHGFFSTEGTLFGHLEFPSAIAQGKSCPSLDGWQTDAEGKAIGSLRTFKEMVQKLINETLEE